MWFFNRLSFPFPTIHTAAVPSPAITSPPGTSASASSTLLFSMRSLFVSPAAPTAAVKQMKPGAIRPMVSLLPWAAKHMTVPCIMTNMASKGPGIDPCLLQVLLVLFLLLVILYVERRADGLQARLKSEEDFVAQLSATNVKKCAEWESRLEHLNHLHRSRQKTSADRARKIVELEAMHEAATVHLEAQLRSAAKSRATIQKRDRHISLLRGRNQRIKAEHEKQKSTASGWFFAGWNRLQNLTELANRFFRECEYWKNEAQKHLSIKTQWEMYCHSLRNENASLKAELKATKDALAGVAAQKNAAQKGLMVAEGKLAQEEANKYAALRAIKVHLSRETTHRCAVQEELARVQLETSKEILTHIKLLQAEKRRVFMLLQYIEEREDLSAVDDAGGDEEEAKGEGGVEGENFRLPCQALVRFEHGEPIVEAHAGDDEVVDEPAINNQYSPCPAPSKTGTRPRMPRHAPCQACLEFNEESAKLPVCEYAGTDPHICCQLGVLIRQVTFDSGPDSPYGQTVREDAAKLLPALYESGDEDFFENDGRWLDGYFLWLVKEHGGSYAKYILPESEL